MRGPTAASALRAAELEARHRAAAQVTPPDQVLATNDGKAGRLAVSMGLAWRTSAEVLREMVLAGTGTLDATAAWDLHQRMDQVTRCPAARAPTGPAFFA